jgi:ABC-2 type transport system permease protein
MAGRLDGAEAALGFAVGLAWTAAFALLYLVGWRRGVRRYQAVAG